MKQRTELKIRGNLNYRIFHNNKRDTNGNNYPQFIETIPHIYTETKPEFQVQN